MTAPKTVKARILSTFGFTHDGKHTPHGEVADLPKELAEHLFRVHKNGGGFHGAVPLDEEPVVPADPTQLTDASQEGGNVKEGEEPPSATDPTA